MTVRWVLRMMIRMFTSVWMISVFAGSITTALSPCPEDCLCEGYTVQCSGIIHLNEIPPETKTLILSNNSLENLPSGMFKNMKYLQQLDLSNNDLGEETTLPGDTFVGLTSLQTLSLSNNELEWFSADLFKSLGSLRTLNVSANPLVCDCDLASLVNSLREDGVNIIENGCFLEEQKRSILNMNCTKLPDDCHLDKSKCHKYAKCEMNEDDEGKFSLCTCRKGFEGDGIECKDKDECLDHASTKCHQRAQCINTFGSYKCRCGPFYTGNGTYCQDIDDCLQRGRCREDEVCKNVAGGFECNCHHGYTKTSPHPDSRCRDIDECTETKKCSTLVNCTNSIGSYRCGPCPQGYVGDGHYCNVECDVKRCSQGAICVDTRSGPFCRCGFGMYVSDNVCNPAEDIIKIQHVRVNRYFTRGLRRFNSPAFLEYARHVEPDIIAHMRSAFPSVVDVQVVRISSTDIRTISLVDFVVLLNKKNAVVTKDMKQAMDAGLKEGKLDSLHATNIHRINVNVAYTDRCDLNLYQCGKRGERGGRRSRQRDSAFKCVPVGKLSYKCLCKDGYVLKDDRCLKDRTAQKVVIFVIVIVLVITIGVGIWYVRRRKQRSKGLSTKDHHMQNFNNAAYREDLEETTTL